MNGLIKSLVTAGLVLFLFQAPALSGEEEPPWADCEICGMVFKDVELMKAVDYKIHKWSEGVIYTICLKNPALMPRLRAFEEKDRVITEKFKKMGAKECSESLCQHCADFFAFVRKGVTEERVDTPTGWIMVTRTADPGLCKEYHAWADKITEAMKEFEKEMGCSGEESACSDEPSTCSDAPSACSGELPTGCGGQGKCDMEKGECSGMKGTAGPTGEEMLRQMGPYADIMKKCFLCREFIKNPEMLVAARNDVVYLENGIALNAVVKNPKNLEAYQEMEKRSQKLYAQVGEMEPERAKKEICNFCMQFYNLQKSGAVFSWGITSTGALSVITGDNDTLVMKINNVGKMFEMMMKMSEQGSK